jgi:hypothetical protein
VDAEGGDAASEEQKEAVQFMAVQTEVLKAQKEVGEKLGFTGDEGCASPSNCVATTRLLLHTNTHTHTHTHTTCIFLWCGYVLLVTKETSLCCCNFHALSACVSAPTLTDVVCWLTAISFAFFFSYSFASTCWQVHQDASIAYGAWNG